MDGGEWLYPEPDTATPPLVVIVPTRGRPAAVARVASAWHDTGALDDGAAGLLFAADEDDPQVGGYLDAVAEVRHPGVRVVLCGLWRPMVPKLNRVATRLAAAGVPYLGFAGDDHLPRTRGWARQYTGALAEMGTGIVHGDDGRWGAELPTEWAMTVDIVSLLRRMVPARVAHLYCDNAVRDLGAAAGCLRYLDAVVIEHMHPACGKAPNDEGYAAVNSERRYTADAAAYRRWRAGQLGEDAAAVRALRAARITHDHP